MKRKTPNSTIDEFFTASISKKQPPAYDKESAVKSSNNNNKLIIVKTASQKKVLKIEIPSLQKKEKELGDQYYENKFSTIADSLVNGIDTLFSGNYDQVNFTKLHNDVECYCRFKSSRNLFENILMPKITEITNAFIGNLSTQNLDIFQISNIIQSFEESLCNLRKIILYLDRAYIFAHRINGFQSISEIVHNLIRKIFLEQINNKDQTDLSSINTPTLRLIINQVELQINLFRCSLDNMDEEDREKKRLEISKKFTKINGRFIKEPDNSDNSHSTIHNPDEFSLINDDKGTKALSIVLKFIDDIGLYESHVEEELVKQTEDFYSTISHELNLSQFLDWLSVAQEKEAELLEAGVKVSTINYILQSINKAALIDNQALLFGPEFETAVDSRDDTVIQKLYSFFDNSDLRGIFTEHLGKHMSSIATNILNNVTVQVKNSPSAGRTIAGSDKAEQNFFLSRQKKDTIVILIEMNEKVTIYLNEVFPDDKVVLTSVRGEFDHFFMNKSETLAKMLAKHFNKGLPIEREEIDFFKMIHSKDIFEASYFYLITQRILNWSHPSVDVSREKILIGHLKEISGSMLVERLQTIVDDLEVSLKAEESIKSVQVHKVPFNFRAVALSYQNMSTEIFYDDVKYPSDVQQCLGAFEKSFIKEKKPVISQPQIHWSSKLTTVAGKIGGLKCQMTGDQALILLALQSGKKDAFSVDDLHEETGINVDTISDNLAVLQTKEAGFIVKKVDENMFKMNPESSFADSSSSDSSRRVVFPSTSAVAAQKEKEANESYVEVAKSNKIMCSIVSKMKVFKILSLSDLYAKVKRDVGFEPDMKKFSAIVSSLADKFYLERINDKQVKYTTT